MIPQLTSKLVQSPSGSIHIRGLRRVIEGEKLKPQLLGVFGLDTRLRPRPEEPLDPSVPEALDHFV
jgi:hypothetical protein